ncbi:RNA 2'-phosphotransferase [Thermodesulfobacteriota bacterium]
MGQPKSPKQLSKLITYVLGRQPDEFGLIPGRDGFVKVKELLKAINEENGWKYVRRQHLDEILFTIPDPPIEIRGDIIRAKNRDRLPLQTLPQNLPKLLFTCVRQKAHPVILDKGIFPMGRSQVILSSSRDMAERMGKRIDQRPVLLTVHVHKSLAQGILFYQVGQTIYLTEAIPVNCFSGPPLPKQKPVPKKEHSSNEQYPKRLAGSFLINRPDEKEPQKRSPRKQKIKEIAWKKDRKNMKKQKQKMWPI